MIANIITKFQIPDPKRPIPCEGRKWGPSGALQPFTPPLLLPEHVLGRVVREISASVGTYGMGGPGFFGLRLGDEWLVISIRGAAEWILVDDRLVMDTFGDKYERPEPWTVDDGNTHALDQRIAGSSLVALDIRKTSLEIRFSSGAVMVIDEAPARRPILEGSKEPREFLPDEDLRSAVFLSPTTEIWI